MSASPIDENLKKLRELKDSIDAHWKWANDAAAPALHALKDLQATDENNWLRTRVRDTREQAEGVYGSVMSKVGGVTKRVEDAVDTASGRFDSVKTRALELRRQSPLLLVLGVTALTILPVHRAGVRTILRNAFVGGSAAAFFLYPEFIARTAPYVDRASSNVSKHAYSTAEKLGIVKPKGGDEG